MSNTEWKEYKLGDIASFKYGTMPKKDLVSLGGQFPIYSGYRIVGSYPEYNLEQSELIIVARGVGGTGDVKLSPEKCFLTNLSIVAFLDESIILKKYAYYYFALNNLRYLDSGSAQSQITISDLQKVVVPVPPLAEQRRIVKVLSSLDDKIELNNAINRNLEEQAQAIFKSWFVDFEPFGGEMPADWKETSLGEVCLKVTDGSHFSPQDDPSAPYPMFSVKDMETYGFNPTNCKHISAEDFEKMKAGDCVPKIDDVLVAKDGSYLKEIFICSEAREEAILSSIAIFRPNKSKILPEILLFLLKQPSVRKDVGDNFVSGSALPRIVLKDFKKYRFILPSMQIQQKLVKMLNSIRMEIHNNVDENQRLSVLRDSLLPRLMSVELGC